MRKIGIFYFFILFIFPPLIAIETTYTSGMDFTPFIHEYVGQYPYEGDGNGYFKGDLVAILDDGSSWKIHPKHNERFINWTIGDKVHIELRKSWYFFKREHKFILCNHQKNEGLHVMLLNTPFVVDYAAEPVPTSRIDNGLFYSYSDYKQNLILNNQSKWLIDSNKKGSQFSKNTPVYVGFNAKNDQLDSKIVGSFFMISGTGKDAQWEWAKQGNYIFLDNWH